MATHLGNSNYIKVEKPWGYEAIFTGKTDKYIGKILVINRGEELSLQFHSKKTETILVLDGKLEVEYGGSNKEYTLTRGDTIHIEPTTVHRFRAPDVEENKDGVLLIEVSTHFPNDTHRLADKYGRAESDEVRKE